MSVFYFTRNHRLWLHVKQKRWNDFKIISVFYFTL